jgi:nitronate monooxygenase
VRHAQKAEELGVDAVCLVGAECGGHPGLNLTGSIVQSCLAAERVKVPIAIGGGIGHGRQIAAILAIGADAALLGTRMTVASEIWARDEYKQRVIGANETNNRLVLEILRNTYRVMDNEAARKVAEMEKAGVNDYAAYKDFVGGLRTRQAYETGDCEDALLSMGQSAVFADAIKPVEEIYDELLDQAAEAAARFGRLSAASEAA